MTYSFRMYQYKNVVTPKKCLGLVLVCKCLVITENTLYGYKSYYPTGVLNMQDISDVYYRSEFVYQFNWVV